MRHFGSLLAGLVVAPLAWVLIAAGQPRMQRTYDRWSTADDIYTGDVLGPLGLVLGAGLLIGLIVALRLSPVGPLVAGVLYLGVYGYAVREPTWVVDTLPQFEINGYPIDTVPPFTNGTIALAGAALVVAALSRRRWQRWPVAGTAGSGSPGSGAPGVGPAPDTTGALPVPESPAPAGAYGPAGIPATAAYTPNEAAAGPPPALGEGPLWPSTVSPAPAYSQPADGSTLTREAMYAGLTPGTAEDLPRRTPPKRPAEAGTGTDRSPEPAPPSDPVPPATPGDPVPPAGRTPAIPSPRHAAAAEGWPLDTWPTADRPTIQPTFQVPPETPSSDLTQPVPPQPVPPQPVPTQPVAPPAVPPSAEQTQPSPSAANQPGPTEPTAGQPGPAGQPGLAPPTAGQPATPGTPGSPGQPDPSAAPPSPPDSAAPPGQASPAPAGTPPQRPVNPLAPQRPISPPSSGPPRPRPVNPLAQRPPVVPPLGQPEAPSDATQRLPAQPPTSDDSAERPADPPASSPWAAPPRPPQDNG